MKTISRARSSSGQLGHGLGLHGAQACERGRADLAGRLDADDSKGRRPSGAGDGVRGRGGQRRMAGVGRAGAREVVEVATEAVRSRMRSSKRLLSQTTMRIFPAATRRR